MFSIPLIVEEDEVTLIWKGEQNGMYTVRSMYNLAMLLSLKAERCQVSSDWAVCGDQKFRQK